MPPKKRSRISTAASPAPPQKETSLEPETEEQEVEAEAEVEAEQEGEEEEEGEEGEEEEEEEDEEALAQAQFDAANVADPWTDDEEIGLFKGLIKWKPTGIHKHFHLLSLQQYLLTNGYIHPGASHTRIPGIWAKLRTLYDLDALDERENAHALPWSQDDDDEADELGNEGDESGDEEAAAAADDFELPEEEFGVLMWRQRFPGTDDEKDENDDEGGEEGEGGREASSPPAAEDLVARRDSPPVRFTPSFDVALSEEKPTPSRRNVKTPASKGKGAKSSLGGRASAVSAATRRSSRVADSVDPEEDDEDEDEGEESGEESGAASTASGTPAPKGRARHVAATRAKSATTVKSRAKRKR